MKIGYARVSTLDQNLDMQLDALKKANCERIFCEQQSATKNRPEFEKAISHLRPGDSLVVWKLDRLGRNVRQLVNLAEELKERQINLQSLQDGIDTATAYGNMLFVLCSAFAELELTLVRERTAAGLAAARARGRKGGRPAISDEKKQAIRAMYADKNITISDIMKTLNVGRATVFKYSK